jgi:hypothetical protein
MTRKTLKKVKSQKKSKSQLRKTRKVRKHKVGGAGRGTTIAKLPTLNQLKHKWAQLGY